MVFEDLEPLIAYHFLPCWPCVVGLILRWGNSSSNGWFIPPFPFCGKIVILKKNCKVLRVVYTYWRRIIYYPYGICFRGTPYRKNCFKMEWVLLLFLYGAKSSENNGPNAQPAQCKTPSECYKNRYIRRYWRATNWILCLCFCCGSTVCHWWRFLFICSKHFESWGLVWLSWPKYGSHYYFFKIAR